MIGGKYCINILYATTGGQSHELSRRIRRHLTLAFGVDVNISLRRCDSLYDIRESHEIIENTTTRSFLIVILPTYGDGTPPPMARVIFILF